MTNTAEGFRSQTYNASIDLAELNELAANGLIPMFDLEKQLFCFRLNRTSTGLVREGLSPRYTIMSLLGLHRLATARRQPSAIPVKPVLNGLLASVDRVNNIGDLGLLLWLCAVVSPDRLGDLGSDVDVLSALSSFPDATQRLTTELAWFLTGLAYATMAGGKGLPNLREIAARTYTLLKNNQGNHGFFGHLDKTRSLKGVVRGRIGSFADQVYPIYALTRFAQAFDDREALNRAQSCAEAICRLQGPLGQWWWHYDAGTGRVFQRYPVYAVHQEAMAPMALFAVGEATRVDFSKWIYKGLAWIAGNNELCRDMRETSSSLVWRSIYRKSRSKMYYTEFLDFLRPPIGAVAAKDLAIRSECRPYELGWLLYAFAPQEGK